MSTLRKIDTKAGFSAFCHQLHQEIKTNPDPKLTQLQGMVAKALGARDLGAFQATLKSKTEALNQEPSEAPAHPWRETENNVFVLVCQGLVVHGGGLEPYRMRSSVDKDLLIFTPQEKEDIERRESMSYFLPNQYKQCSARFQSIEKVYPELIRDLTAESIPALRAPYDHAMQDAHSWSSHPLMERSDWEYETSQHDTQLGYWEWVASQLEQWVEEVESRQ